jgi:hypothetical protein
MCVPLLLALAAGGLAPVARADAGSPAPPPAPAPPALQALEQKMAQIRFNTARVSLRTVLGDFDPVAGGELAADGAVANRLITTTSALLSYSPRAFAATSTLDGAFGRRVLHREAKERLIGRSLYVDVPSLARSDGGRPWVRSEERRVAGADGGNEGEPLAAAFAALAPAVAIDPQPGESGNFVGLSEDLRAAQSIHEIASLTPLTVDGQPVSGFTASIPAASLLAHRVSPRQLRRLLATAKADEKIVALEVFIAPSGLPVRATLELGAGEEGVGIQEDVLGLEVPVVLAPPPADKTITQARLDRLKSRCPHACKRRRAAAAARCGPAPPAWPASQAAVPGPAVGG